MTARIEIGAPIGDVSPLLFGHFIEFIEDCIIGGVYQPEHALANSRGVRMDVLEKCRTLRPSILRFPGGTAANLYHWENDVGPVENRRLSRNLIWGGQLGGGFGTDEYIRFCRDLGAEPMICINMVTGTPEEAGNWVEYCNGTGAGHYSGLRIQNGHDEPFSVKYWCIGNESNGEPDLGPHHRPSRYIEDAWEFAKIMKLTDPDISLIFVGSAVDMAWNAEILEALSPICDYLSLHYYGRESDEDPLYSFRQTEFDFADSMQKAAALCGRYPAKVESFDRWYRFPPRKGPIRLCIDEWGLWNSHRGSDTDPYGFHVPYTWRSAVWTADFLNLLVRSAKNIGIANFAQLINVLAPIITSEDRTFVQSVFHPLSAYSREIKPILLDLKIECNMIGETERISALSGCVTADEDGDITLALVNRGSEPVPCLVPGMNHINAWALRAPKMNSICDAASDPVTRTDRDWESFGGYTLAPGEILFSHLTSCFPPQRVKF